MNHQRDNLLFDVLRALIREWGAAKVTQILSEVSKNPGGGNRADENQNLGAFPNAANQRTKSRKPSAIELVRKSEASDDKRVWLMTIAERFDQKRFLPSVSDLREFLRMTGTESVAVRDRSDGFRLLLRVLEDLPSERLERLAHGSRFSGPSQLGPLADAIRATGEARRRPQVDPSDG